MVGWHHRLDGHEFGQVPGVGDGQGSLAWCSARGLKRAGDDGVTELTDLLSRPAQGHSRPLKTCPSRPPISVSLTNQDTEAPDPPANNQVAASLLTPVLVSEAV